MKRRVFVNASAAGLAAVVTIKPLISRAFVAAEAERRTYDLVAVKGGEPDKLFDAGMAALGGMGRYVKPGQTVVVKPNIAWEAGPERAANTNPLLVRRIVEHCYEAGAKKVYVFDYTCDDWRRSYRASGIDSAARDAGATVAPGDGERYFHPVAVGGRALKQAAEHELILGSDVFINVPVLKHHGSAGLTIAMKNLMGVIWDRQFWHRHDLHQCIADFACYRKPDLNVVDAFNVLMRHGPRGISAKDVVQMRSQLISADMVTADAAAARLFGAKAHEIPYIRIAAEQGAGRMDLENLSIKRIEL
ncbi:MAG: DUF362 domain-containing protein [Chromatiaceae bacterium]|jgi:uncharacterized protein (DUF362 family)